jgi:Ni/Fe-hydrogenase 1 B-type cytochrome subunit
MSLARGVHFFFAAVLIVATVIRIIMMFIGKNRDWPSILINLKDLALLPRFIAYYLHFTKREPKLSKKYNPLQMIAYVGVFILIVFQILSGLGMLYPDSFMAWFSYGIFGNEYNARIAHYIVNWTFVVFLAIHMYLIIRPCRPDEAEGIKEMHSVNESE